MFAHVPERFLLNAFQRTSVKLTMGKETTPNGQIYKYHFKRNFRTKILWNAINYTAYSIMATIITEGDC